MPSSGSRLPIVFGVLAALCVAAMPGNAQPSVLIVTDDCPPEADLEATGLFDQVDTFDHAVGTPTLVQLQGYDAVFAFSNDTPMSPVELGNTLADYVDLGGCVSMATYAFSADWAIAGRIMTTGYSPFLHTPMVDLVSLDGGFIRLVPDDAIFEGVDTSIMTYDSNKNMADGTLDTGAIALATDGVGVNMVARAGDRPVFGFNVFAVGEQGLDCGDNSAELFRMIANSLANCRGIFADDFETSNYCRWSDAIPQPCA